MGRADTRTQLPLDTFARIMGINPMHFNGALATNVSPTAVMPIENSCSDLFPQHSWQFSDRVGREELAIEIAAVEKEIEDYIGFPLSPKWIKEEHNIYPQPFYPEVFGSGSDVRNRNKTVRLDKAHFLGFGKRSTTLIDQPTPVYSDEDSDGYNETATLTVVTTVTDPKEIKVYFTGKSANPTWEIRPLRSVTIAGGTATIVFDSYLAINPDLWEAFPTDAGFTAIDVSTDANYVTTVDVYREYVDNSVAAVTFYWGEPCLSCGGSGCASCNAVSQDGCGIATNVKAGLAELKPATWDATTSAWVSAAWSGGREPDRYEVWYKAGLKSDDYIDGYSLEPMPTEMARHIAWMTVSRLERDLCNCSNVSNMTTWLREDLTNIGEGPKYFTQREWALSAFGTRRGEVSAWRYFSRLVNRRAKVASI